MKRDLYLKEIHTQLRIHPACGLLGPRQVGKTTLAKMYVKEYFPEDASFFDLEDPVDLARLENPMFMLSKISNQLIVIDEIQRRPELFPYCEYLPMNMKRNEIFNFRKCFTRTDYANLQKP